ncbi:response regulator [Sorangium sp. So ce1014]|uniref:response regulator n=1 Tax=Sorangium sp. So ce1014 TaxID=3133326 RepID=UPI003F60C429
MVLLRGRRPVGRFVGRWKRGSHGGHARWPDLILLDVVMPHMNGFDACRQLRADDATRSTPILLVTSRSDVAHMEEGFRCGCSDFVTKPIDTMELLEKVRNCLGD